ncbi:MAG: hypothetical protein EXX96DRAFT_490544, partial [Benjaminiella poitrasii]
EEYWLKNNIINLVMLFIDGPTIPPVKGEQGLLDDVFGFVKTSKRLSHTNTETGTESLASSENAQLILSLKLIVNRQLIHAGLVFKHLSRELGCVEIGLAEKGPNDTKELQESTIKSPTMLKSFVYQLTEHYRIAPDNIKVVAIVISGMSISVQIMTCSKGSASLMSTSLLYRLPESTDEIARLLPSVLKLVYNRSQIIKNIADHLRRISSSVDVDYFENVYFPPCFVAAFNEEYVS